MAVSGDAQGQAMAASQPASAASWDGALESYLGARRDTPERLTALLTADPACVLGHCLDGYLQLLASRGPAVARARAALEHAEAAARSLAVSAREGAHLEALRAWAAGDMRGAARAWDAALALAPRDLLALRVSQFVLSYLGETERMLETVARVLPAWEAGVPGYGYVLGCHAYALEELGDYARAETQGRRAVELNPSDIWAAHAVTHVTEMVGRPEEGVTWITNVSGYWSACNNFTFHLRWHEALFHLDLDNYARVLELYDREVRPTSTDEYLDVANAASLLWRLEQAGVDVGARWQELADRARARVNDRALVFADLHDFLALAAVGDAETIAAWFAASERFATSAPGTQAVVMREVGLPLARALAAHRRGSYGEVVDLMMPVRGDVRRIGGSHAQRDLFEQVLIDAAMRARRFTTATELLAERTTRRPRNVWGWKAYATALDALGARAAARAAARRLTEVRTS